MAREDAHKKRVFGKKLRKKAAHSIYARHIARKDKKECERQKKRIVDAPKRLSISKKQREGYHYKPYPIRYAAENYRYREREQCKIQRRALWLKLCRPAVQNERLGPHKNKAAYRYQRHRYRKRRRHYGHKFPARYRKARIKIKILRIAERRKHTAEVCRYVLHYKRERHQALLAGRGQHIITKRQKRQKRHVVRYKH